MSQSESTIFHGYVKIEGHWYSWRYDPAVEAGQEISERELRCADCNTKIAAAVKDIFAAAGVRKLNRGDHLTCNFDGILINDQQRQHADREQSYQRPLKKIAKVCRKFPLCDHGHSQDSRRSQSDLRQSDRGSRRDRSGSRPHNRALTGTIVNREWDDSEASTNGLSESDSEGFVLLGGDTPRTSRSSLGRNEREAESSESSGNESSDAGQGSSIRKRPLADSLDLQTLARRKKQPSGNFFVSPIDSDSAKGMDSSSESSGGEGQSFDSFAPARPRFKPRSKNSPVQIRQLKKQIEQYKGTVAALEAKQAKLAKQMKKQQELFDDLGQAGNDQRVQFGDLLVQKEQLQTQLMRNKSDLSHLQSALTKKQAKLNGLTDRFGIAQEQAEQAKQETVALTEQMEGMRAKHAEKKQQLKGRLAELEHLLKEAQEKTTGLEEAVEGKEQEVLAVKGELEQLKQEQQSAEDNLQSQIEEAEAAEAHAQEQSQYLQQELEGAKEIQAKMQLAVEQINQENDELQAKIRDLTGRNNALGETVVQQAEAIAAHLATVEELRNVMRQIENEKKGFEDRVNELQEENGRLNEEQRGKEQEFQERFHQAAANLDDAKQREDLLQKQVEELLKDIEGKNAQNAEQAALQEKLNDDLAAAQEEKKRAEEVVKELHDQMNEQTLRFETETQENQQEIQALQEKVTALEASEAVHANQLAGLHAQIEALTHTNDQLQGVAEGLRVDNEQLQRSLGEKEEGITQLEEKKMQLTERLAELEERNQQLHQEQLQEIEQQKQLIADALGSLDSADRSKKELEEALAAITEEKNLLAQQAGDQEGREVALHRALEEQISSLKKDLERVAKQKEELEQKLSQSREDSAALVDGMEKFVATTSVAVEQIKNELGAAEEELHKAQEELAESQQTVMKLLADKLEVENALTEALLTIQELESQLLNIQQNSKKELIESHRAEIVEREQRNKLLSERIPQIEQELERKKQELVAAVEENEQLVAELEGAQEKLAAINLALQPFTGYQGDRSPGDHIHQIHDEMRRQKQEIEALQQAQTESEEEISSLREELGSLKAEQQVCQETIAQDREEIDILREQLDHLTKSYRKTLLAILEQVSPDFRNELNLGKGDRIEEVPVAALEELVHRHIEALCTDLKDTDHILERIFSSLPEESGINVTQIMEELVGREPDFELNSTHGKARLVEAIVAHLVGVASLPKADNALVPLQFEAGLLGSLARLKELLNDRQGSQDPMTVALSDILFREGAIDATGFEENLLLLEAAANDGIVYTTKGGKVETHPVAGIVKKLLVPVQEDIRRKNTLRAKPTNTYAKNVVYLLNNIAAVIENSSGKPLMINYVDSVAINTICKKCIDELIEKIEAVEPTEAGQKTIRPSERKLRQHAEHQKWKKERLEAIKAFDAKHKSTNEHKVHPNNRGGSPRKNGQNAVVSSSRTSSGASKKGSRSQGNSSKTNSSNSSGDKEKEKEETKRKGK